MYTRVYIYKISTQQRLNNFHRSCVPPSGRGEAHIHESVHWHRWKPARSRGTWWTLSTLTHSLWGCEWQKLHWHWGYPAWILAVWISRIGRVSGGKACDPPLSDSAQRLSLQAMAVCIWIYRYYSWSGTRWIIAAPECLIYSSGHGQFSEPTKLNWTFRSSWKRLWI